MTKNILIIFLLLTSTLAFASPISYSDFIHMNRDQQVKTIELVHKYLNEYELKLKQGTVTPKQTKKYHSYLKILNLFIGTAHADDEVAATSVAAVVPTSAVVEASDKCFYGGWISLIRQTGADANQAVCLHPNYLAFDDNKNFLQDNKSPEVKEYYEKVSKQFQDAKEYTSIMVNPSSDGSVELDYTNGKGCNEGRLNIMCNPDVYGLLDQGAGQAKSILCIKDGKRGLSGSSMGINISYLCDKALQKMKTDKLEDHDKMMDHVISLAISKPDGDFFQTLKTMYSTCMCGGGNTQAIRDADLSGTINSQYVEKLFASRTCVGIMQHTDRIKDTYLRACKVEGADAAQFDQEWIKFFNTAEDKIGTYIDELQNIQFTNVDSTNLSNSELQRIFEEDKNLYKDKADLIYKTAKEGGLCPVNLEKVAVEPAQAEVETPVLSCEITEKEGSDLLSVAISITPNPDEIKTDDPALYSITVEGGALEEETFDIKLSEGTEEASAEVSITGNSDIEKVSCEYKKEEEEVADETTQPEKAATCTVELAMVQNDEGKFDFTPTIKFLDSESKKVEKADEPKYHVLWYNDLEKKGNKTDSNAVDTSDLAGTVSEEEDEESDEEREYASEIEEYKDTLKIITNKKGTGETSVKGIIRKQTDSTFIVVVEPRFGGIEAVEGSVADDDDSEEESKKFKSCIGKVTMQGIGSLPTNDPVRLAPPQRRQRMGGFMMSGNR